MGHLDIPALTLSSFARGEKEDGSEKGGRNLLGATETPTPHRFSGSFSAMLKVVKSKTLVFLRRVLAFQLHPNLFKPYPIGLFSN
jgi:hypothetical protein